MYIYEITVNQNLASCQFAVFNHVYSFVQVTFSSVNEVYNASTHVVGCVFMYYGCVLMLYYFILVAYIYLLCVISREQQLSATGL